jgi:NADH-quinone oxidoreductase subunit J
MESVSIAHWIAGGLAIASALLVVLSGNPVISAMGLMAALFLTGGLYFGLGALFIGVVQILIYAGAIAVLFVFIVMLLDLKRFRVRIPGRQWAVVLAGVSGLGLFAGLFINVLPGAGVGLASSDELNQIALLANDAKTISLHFISKYMLPFQVANFLILAAVIGSIIFGKFAVQKKES